MLRRKLNKEPDHISNGKYNISIKYRYNESIERGREFVVMRHELLSYRDLLFGTEAIM